MPEGLEQAVMNNLNDKGTDTPAQNVNEDLTQLRGKIIEKTNKIRRMRVSYERQWITNVAFLYGKHYFELESRGAKSGLEQRIVWELKNIQRQKLTRRTSNYILPLYRSLHARMLQMKAVVNIEASTRTENDRNAARAATEFIEDFWDTANQRNPVLCDKYPGMQLTISKLLTYMLSTGGGYLYPFWNPNSPGKTVLNGQVQEGKIGQVEVEVCHDFEVLPDPLGRSLTREKVASTEELFYLFGKEVKPTDVEISDSEKQILNMLEGGTSDMKYDNAAKVYYHWELPSGKHPNGRQMIFTDKEWLQEPIDLDPDYRGCLPMFRFRYLDIMLSQYSQGFVDQLIQSQEEYNFTISKLYGYKKWMSGKLKVPQGCAMKTRYDDEIGQIIIYNSSYGEPHWDMPKSAPAQLFKDLDRIRRDMEDIAAVHDVSLSRVPRGVKSGVAIENLTELDNTSISPQLISTEEKLGFFVETVLEMIKNHYSEPRLLSTAGEDLGVQVRSFQGSEVEGNRRVKVTLGSSLPMSKEARRTTILGLADKEYITKEKALKLLEFGDVEGIFHSVDETAEKAELEEMLTGIVFQAFPWETHHIRLKVLSDFMNTKKFRDMVQSQDPEQQKIAGNIIDHRSQHQRFLQLEMEEAAKNVEGQVDPGAGGGETKKSS